MIEAVYLWQAHLSERVLRSFSSYAYLWSHTMPLSARSISIHTQTHLTQARTMPTTLLWTRGPSAKERERHWKHYTTQTQTHTHWAHASVVFVFAAIARLDRDCESPMHIRIQSLMVRDRDRFEQSELRSWRIHVRWSWLFRTRAFGCAFVVVHAVLHLFLPSSFHQSGCASDHHLVTWFRVSDIYVFGVEYFRVHVWRKLCINWCVCVFVFLYLRAS